MTIRKFLQKISQILAELKIDYIISGGVAISVWGRSRYTADVDILIEINQTETVKKLIGRLRKEFPLAYTDEEQALNAFQRKSSFNIIEPEYGLKADFFIAETSPYEQAKIKLGKKKKIGGSWIKFISPEDLIIAKLQWYRESQSTRHLEDIYGVMAVQKNLNRKYLKKWIGFLGLEEEWAKIKTWTR